ncbi:BZ3500_MvSof-1268-A1-R1_Chr2-2g04770 [Microbotryum saponariae]|uniref:BZ3500_MvSof-1268-A1-R1_Chr2-2g04770 protein n=1 Tax=Microbotryum saponariae TaxID=289078 RepID=A0A2X0M6T6_9BASI|nr:BZ3500_MvSof-1268-A1-R1_Chr2-2g04770 [Microbotryum saponariae]SDA00124.1 BZ3501_MvSof-1269-A2-R1_Chr2-2g04444 [Microbotryum saponariae]
MSVYDVIHQVPSATTGLWIPLDEALEAKKRADSLKPQRPAYAFTLVNRSFPSLTPDDDYAYILLHDEDLLDAVKRLFPTLGSLYQSRPGIDARSLYVRRDQLLSLEESLSRAEDGSESSVGQTLRALRTLLDQQFSHIATKLASFPAGTISWRLLWTLFKVGQEIESAHDVTGEMIALKLDSWAYVQESMGRVFQLSCHFYQWAGTCYHKMPVTRRVNEFDNLRAITSLKTLPLSNASKAMLAGQPLQSPIVHVCQSHVEYSGFFYTRAFSGASRLLGDGQVVIDVKSFRRANPVLDQWGDDVNDQGGRTQYQPRPSGSSIPCESFREEDCYLLPPTLHGFSLRTKASEEGSSSVKSRWGEFLISRLTPVQWGDASFSHLVIPESYRRIIRALVTVHASNLKDQLMQDVVEGKGTGLIMAFHGTPGTGKTLAAEAIAEHLRRPLYVVGAGEMVLTAAGLERQLKDTLEVGLYSAQGIRSTYSDKLTFQNGQLATSWNAVLLIDEADIFLTRRSPGNLEHNALVGVFLRQLEYFTGVLILTTNVIEQLDDAFISRFAVVLHFKTLDSGSRRILWERFLAKAEASPNEFNLDRLSSFEMNGRDIKHAVRMAQAVALVEKERLCTSHLEEVIAVAKSGFEPLRN